MKVNYRGTLLDGTEFDSSYARNEPATFPLGRVIPCWTEGVQRMKAGGKAQLVCPPQIAYGERGAGGTIPPNATLRFEIELLEINPELSCSSDHPATTRSPLRGPIARGAADARRAAACGGGGGGARRARQAPIPPGRAASTARPTRPPRAPLAPPAPTRTPR